MRSEHCDKVASLHLANLKTPFKGKPGKEMLKRYYLALCENKGACGYVAQEGNRISGYVCGIWDAKTLKKKLLKRYWLQLGFWAFFHVLISPFIIAEYSKRFREKEILYGLDQGNYELRPIVLAAKARGTGLASELVNALLNDAARRGFSEICLYAQADNSAANKYYRKTGFICDGKVIHSGQIYLRYKHALEGYP